MLKGPRKPLLALGVRVDVLTRRTARRDTVDVQPQAGRMARM
jgi:hypothetical protein